MPIAPLPREAEVRDEAIEAIDEAITKFRAGLKATDRKLVDGVWVEEPRMRVTPRDVTLLIDRLQILFGRPSTISEGREFVASMSSDALPIDALRSIVELTRGLESPRDEGSPLPRSPRSREN